MKSNILLKLFIISLIISGQVIAQTENRDLNDKKFPIINDSIPLNIIQNIPCERGYEAFNNGQFEKAIKFYNSSLSIDPDDQLAIYNRALCYYKIQDAHRSCLDFKYSAYMGFQNSINNYKSFCDSNSYTFSYLDSGFVYYKSTQDSVNINEFPDSLPEFPGGLDSLYFYIIKKFRSESLKNYDFTVERSLLKFTINEDGSVSDPTIIKRNADFKGEQIQLISSMPKWKPAYKNGKQVKCTYLFPFINGKMFNQLNNHYYNLGVLNLNENKLNESITSFNNALLFKIRDFDAYYNRGISYYKMKDFFNACMNWTRARQINKDNKSINDLLNKYCDSTNLNNEEIQKLSSFKYNPSNLTYTIVEEMPRFPGGEEQLFQFIMRRIKYPAKARENGISGRVFITFIIDKDGYIKDAKVLRGIGGGCDEAALDLVRSMPQWIPGKQDGNYVNVQYNLPINFNLR